MFRRLISQAGRKPGFGLASGEQHDAPAPYVATIPQYYGASGWLSVTPASGTTGTAGGTPTKVTLTANLAAVPAGSSLRGCEFPIDGSGYWRRIAPGRF